MNSVVRRRSLLLKCLVLVLYVWLHVNGTTTWLVTFVRSFLKVSVQNVIQNYNFKRC
jgi:hypothetical protein